MQMMPCMLALGLAVSATPAIAQSVSKQSLAGRYALNKAACTARDYFATVKDNAFDLPVFSCTGVDFDQSESKGGVDTYKATAKKCTGEGDVTGKPQKFGVIRKDGTIQFLWSDGTKSGILVKC